MSTRPRLLPGALVHRRQLAEVLLTALDRTSDSTFTADLHWPRRHAYFGPYGAADVDLGPELALETLRQAAIALAHLHLGVPFGHAFLMESMRVEVLDGVLRSADRPGEHTIDIDVSGLVERKGIASAYDSWLTIRDGDQVLARGGGAARIIPAPIYRRMREGAPTSADRDRLPPRPTPAPAAVVGAPGEDFVLIAGDPGAQCFSLSLDVTNAVYFDHPLDHVPGMVVLESALQAFRARAGDPAVVPSAVAVEFSSHTELTAPVTIEVVEDGDETVASFRQDGVVNSRVRARGLRRRVA